jgi:hypothetical protein
MKKTSVKIADKLYLIKLTLGEVEAKPVESPTNHIVVIDCSGSMCGELSQIREQLKRKLPKLIGPEDTLSIIWFSGRGEFGTILEGEPVATLKDLQTVNQAIDRWLRCVGFTGFKEPIEEAARLVGRLSKKRPGSVFSFFFMSDGYDNQWNRAEILRVMEEAARDFAATTIVEYGYYADRNLLAAMAERAGGALIFAEDFDRYAPTFEAVMGKRPIGGKKVKVEVPVTPVGDFVFAMPDRELLTFAVKEGSVLVPEDIGEVWFLSPSAATPKSVSVEKAEALAAVYAAISLFSVRMQPDIVLPLLKVTGDVAFIEKFGGLFGKQKYSEFMEAAKEAAFDPSKRLTKGYDPSRVPPEDAFTVLDLLQILAADDSNRILLDHPEFKYSRIGRRRLEVVEEGQEALKFVADPAPDGYSVSDLTFNEDRPNISVLVRKTGTVDLSGRLKAGLHPQVPRQFPTFIYRNYAIIKDGLVNVAKLPVKLCEATAAVINAMLAQGKAPKSLVGGADSISAGSVVVLDLAELPVINRQMVKSCSAKFLFEKEYQLAKARAAQKVYNTIKREQFPRKSEAYADLYGVEAAAWLKEQGLTDYSGYQPPHTKQDESRDFYMGKELKVSLKGLSSLPTLKKAEEEIAKGKMTPALALMKPAIEDVKQFLASNEYKKAKNPDQLFETWLDGRFKDAQNTVRRLLAELARIKFSVVVGQVWFTEFASLDENTLNLTFDNQPINCKVEMKEIQVAI